MAERALDLIFMETGHAIVCKVLFSVLRHSLEQSLSFTIRRKYFMEALFTHIAATDCFKVCLAMLSTVRSKSELKFSASNKLSVVTMAN